MTYRRVQSEDIPKIIELCKRQGIVYETTKKPLIGFVAVGDEGELIGFVFAHHCALIEPFVCINPTASVKLHARMEGALSALGYETQLIHIPADNDKLNAEAVRSGFSRVDSIDYTILKKE
jgi:hypothetical protein